MTSLNNVILDPNYLAYRFDFNSECVEFLPIEKNQLRQLSFLRADAFMQERVTEAVSVPLADLVELVEQPAQSLQFNPPRFVFHTAYCASTFVSRALDLPEVTLSLREPQLLLDAANAKRLQWKSKTTSLNFTQLPKLALVLLHKHVNDDERLIIKPINSVNNIIQEILHEVGQTRSLILYTGARRFLLSTLKQGEQARQTTRAMFDLLRCDFPHLRNLSLSNALHMSDLKLVLTLWRLQIEQIQAVLNAIGQQKSIVSLDAELLDTDPIKQLIQVNQFLDTGLIDEDMVSHLESGLLAIDAKSPSKNYDQKNRDTEYRRVYDFFANDIENGFRWLLSNNTATNLQPQLPFALGH